MPSNTASNVKTVDDLLKAVLVFSRAVDHVLENHAVEAAVDVPLSGSKVQVLRLLGRRGSQTSTQVARFLGVSKPAVSQIVDAMVRDKQVTRQTATTDRREVNLRLTSQGRSLLNAVHREQRHYIRSAVRSAGSTKPKKWMIALQEIINGLTQADSAFNDFCAQCGAHDDGSCVLVGGHAQCGFLAHEGARKVGRTRKAGKSVATRGTNRTASRARGKRRPANAG